MIDFKVSALIKIVSIPGKDPLTADKLVYSLRTGKILRLSNLYLKRLLACDLAAMPAMLVTVLVRNELVVPRYEDEAAQLQYKQTIYHLDNEILDFQSYAALTDNEIVSSAQSSMLI